MDCIECTLPSISPDRSASAQDPLPKTLQLHGRLDTMMCHTCRWTGAFKSELFHGPSTPSCQQCEKKNAERIAMGKRSIGIGRLRPKVLLYGETDPNDTIGATSVRDLMKGPDAVIIAGTLLKIPAARRLAREFCRAAKARKGGITIWINKEWPSLGKDFEGLLDYTVCGDCDTAASIFSANPGH